MLAPIDVEAAIVTHLGRVLDVPVGTAVPNPRPASHVRITKTGGTTRTLVASNATVLVECWAPTEADAFALARRVYDALAATRRSGLDGRQVFDAQLNEPVNYPDPDADPPHRYQFLAGLLLRLDITTTV